MSTHAYTTVTATRLAASEVAPTDQERAVALELIHAVALEHQLAATGTVTRVPATFGDGEISVEVWAREEPARFEFVIVEFNVWPPTTRTSDVHHTFERELDRRLPDFQIGFKEERGSQPSGFFYWIMSQ